MGIESQGMILTAESEKTVSLLASETDIIEGSEIH